MDILSYKPGHDGQVAYIRDKELVFSIEAEKDNWPRYAAIAPSHFVKTLKYIDKIPDVVALSGLVKDSWALSDPIEGGYIGEGLDTVVTRSQNFLGKPVDFFSSSHERSHLLCSYGLSPFPQGQPCYALVWEGFIGAFYHIDERVNITKIGDVVEGPGGKYQFLYALADETFPDSARLRFEDAGKLMALVSYGKPGTPDPEAQELIDWILSQSVMYLATAKKDLRHSKYYNIGVQSAEFKQFARWFSDALFQRFFDFAKEHIDQKLPLLISGGCGLNCDWNSMWKQSGLFTDTFVPPCTNDSGSAIGTAIDAQLYYTGDAKVSWDAYAGEEFEVDDVDLTGVKVRPLDLSEVAQFLRDGNIIAWIQGRYEIGPRALGNRSIIAMPFTQAIHTRVNSIKQREGFRPIAPICLEEDIDRYFENHGPSPHMLYFQKVRTQDLPAITHVDGSARLQSVNAEQNPKMHALLTQFKALTGAGVLCNTSLNFKGMGFINRLSDLVPYCRQHGMDGFVVGDTFYTWE